MDRIRADVWLLTENNSKPAERNGPKFLRDYVQTQSWFAVILIVFFKRSFKRFAPQVGCSQRDSALYRCIYDYNYYYYVHRAFDIRPCSAFGEIGHLVLYYADYAQYLTHVLFLEFCCWELPPTHPGPAPGESETYYYTYWWIAKNLLAHKQKLRNQMNIKR